MGKKPVLGWVGVLLAGAGLGGALGTLAGCNNSKNCQTCQAHGPVPASQTVYNPQTTPTGATAQSQAWNMQRNPVPGQPMVNAGTTVANPGTAMPSSTQPWATSQQTAGSPGSAVNRSPSSLPGTSPMGMSSMPAGTVAAMPASTGTTSAIRPVSNTTFDGMPTAGSPTVPGMSQPMAQPVTSARVPTSMTPVAPASMPNVPVVEQGTSKWADSVGQPATVEHDTNYHVVPGSAPAGSDAPMQ